MKTILQVEDDANDVFFLKEALRKAEVPNPVQVATDGQQAIDYLTGAGKFADREKFPMPGLILLDLKLPYVMGLDVLKWIREQAGALVPVLILSASVAESDVETAYRLGANAFLTKPSNPSHLKEMAKAIKDFWLTYNVGPSDPRPHPLLADLANLRLSAMTASPLKPHRSTVASARALGPHAHQSCQKRTRVSY